MNYRHIYHAGNFADVVKHAVLTLVIERLKLKEAAFRVIDTHAGIGSYDLDVEAARKTGEWQGGIGRLLGPDAEPIPKNVAPLLAAYLDVVREANRPGELSRYPGSPAIARALLRPQDRLVVNELHPEDAAELKAAFARDRQTTVMAIDGWIALKALLPPKERRGVMLIDPPFEVAGEMERMEQALREAVKRFATGTYLLWYPIKGAAKVQRFKRALTGLALPKLLVADVTVRPVDDPGVLSGTGLAIVNPPFELERHLDLLLPFLAKRLSVAGGGRHAIEWLGAEAR